MYIAIRALNPDSTTGLSADTAKKPVDNTFPSSTPSGSSVPQFTGELVCKHICKYICSIIT